MKRFCCVILTVALIWNQSVLVWADIAFPKSCERQTTVYVGSIFEKTNGKVIKHVPFGGENVATIEDGKVHYKLPDHLGGTNVVVNEAGEKEQVIEYEPFGELARYDQFNGGEPVSWNYYTGQKFDVESDLYYYGARYYNPQLGRFITADVITPNPFDSISLNRYAYARNNPVNEIDPTGHFSFFAAIAAIFKAASTFAAAHPVIAGAAVGGVLGATNAAINGNNIAQGIGLGVLAGGLGTGVGIGVGSFIQDQVGAFAAGVISSGAGGAVAGAATSGIVGGDVGLGSLAGLAGGVIAFGGSSVWPLGADAVAGGVASVIQGGEFAEGAQAGAINNGLTTMIDLLAPMESLGSQNSQSGDLIYMKASSPIGLLISFFEGGAFSHVGLQYDNENFTSATLQRVPGKDRNGVGSWKLDDYKERQVRIVSRFRGNQNVINAAKNLAISKVPITYGFGMNQKVCSTTCGNAILDGTSRNWAGVGPNSQYILFKSYGE